MIQRLFATGLQLQGLHGITSSQEIAVRLDKAVDELDLTIKDIRSTIFELEDKQPTSLRSDIRALIKEYVPVLGLTPTLRTLGPIDSGVPDELHGQVLAVLREAISNIARHALADHASVEVSVSDRDLVLRVADDGTGLIEIRHESGLRNARRRAATLNGTLEVVPNEPRGTVFIWRVPLGQR